MSYVWGWQLTQKGYKKKPDADMTDWQKACAEYVEHYLTPSIRIADCGWDHARLFVFSTPWGCDEEFVGLFAHIENVGGRYYNVTGCSKGAIAEVVWSGVYA